MMAELFSDEPESPPDETGAPPARAVLPRPGKRPGLPARTGVDWPGPTPAVLAALEAVRDAMMGTDPDALAWVLCACLWRLDRGDLDRVAELVGDRLAAKVPSGRAAA